MRKLHAAFFAAALAAVAAPSPAAEQRDHERARQAMEAGEVLPLKTILERVEREYPGQVLEVELDREDGRWVYHLKLLRTGGTLVKLRVDARDGSVLGLKERREGGKRQGDGP